MWTAPSEAQLLQAVDYGYPQTRERHYLLGYRLAEEGGRAARHLAARQSTADAFRTIFLSPTSAPPEAVGVGVVMLCSAPPEALGVGVVMLCLRAGPQQVHQNMDVLQPWMQECQALLRDFQIDPLPLSECLLPNNSALLQAAQAREAPAAAAAVEHGAHKTYMVDHLQKYGEANLQWPPVLPAERAAAVKHLPIRQQELVHYLYETSTAASSHAKQDPGRCSSACQGSALGASSANQGSALRASGLEEAVLADVNMSIGWVKMHRGACPCLVGTGRVWLFHKNRELSGEEALALQGFDIARQHVDDFKRWQLVELAGNAFNGGVCLAVVSTGLFGLGCLPDVDIDTSSAQASEQGSSAASVQDATQDSRYDELDDLD